MRSAFLKIISLAAMAGSLMAPFSAMANPAWPNWYVGVKGGLNWLQDADVKGSNSGKVSFDDGYSLSAALGYTPAFTLTSVGKGRFELEYRYSKNDLDKGTISGVSGILGGEQESNAIMFNGYYDFALSSTHWSPYLGAGIGYADVNVDSDFNGIALTRDNDNAFAWQLMAGIGYSPENMPFTTWSLGYRYFTTSDLQLTTTAGTGIKVENSNHNLEAGVAMKF